MKDNLDKRITRKAMELPYSDLHIQKRSITLLFNDHRILICNNGPPGMLMYSFFINKKLIAADYMEINTFIKQFKKYLKS
jgi:hypothetical protein